MIKHILGRRLVAVMSLSLICVATLVAFRGESRTEDFEGWIVYKDGQEQRYPAKEWYGSPHLYSFTLQQSKGDDYVTHYGTFRVVRLKKQKPPEPGGKPVPFSWEVTQVGITHIHTEEDGWVIRLNPAGVELDHKDYRVWYFGDVDVHYHGR